MASKATRLLLAIILLANYCCCCCCYFDPRTATTTTPTNNSNNCSSGHKRDYTKDKLQATMRSEKLRPVGGGGGGERSPTGDNVMMTMMRNFWEVNLDGKTAASRESLNLPPGRRPLPRSPPPPPPTQTTKKISKKQQDRLTMRRPMRAATMGRNILGSSGGRGPRAGARTLAVNVDVDEAHQREPVLLLSAAAAFESSLDNTIGLEFVDNIEQTSDDGPGADWPNDKISLVAAGTPLAPLEGRLEPLEGQGEGEGEKQEEEEENNGRLRRPRRQSEFRHRNKRRRNQNGSFIIGNFLIDERVATSQQQQQQQQQQQVDIGETLIPMAPEQLRLRQRQQQQRPPPTPPRPLGPTVGSFASGQNQLAAGAVAIAVAGVEGQQHDNSDKVAAPQPQTQLQPQPPMMTTTTTTNDDNNANNNGYTTGRGQPADIQSAETTTTTPTTTPSHQVNPGDNMTTTTTAAASGHELGKNTAPVDVAPLDFGVGQQNANHRHEVGDNSSNNNNNRVRPDDSSGEVSADHPETDREHDEGNGNGNENNNADAAADQQEGPSDGPGDNDDDPSDDTGDTSDTGAAEAEPDDLDSEEFHCESLENILATRPSRPIGIVFGINYSLIFVFGLIGNVLTLYVLICKGKRCTVQDVLIANLACSDIMLCVFAVPITPKYLIRDGHWTLGSALCKVVSFAQSTSVYMSTYSLICIGYIRYRLIIYPLEESMSKQAAVLFCLGTWLVALIVTLPYMIQVRLTPEHCNIKFCDEAWEKPYRFIFSLFTAFFQFVIPLSSVGFFNKKIYSKLDGRIEHKSAATSTSTSTSNNHSTIRQGQSSSSSSQQQMMLPPPTGAHCPLGADSSQPSQWPAMAANGQQQQQHQGPNLDVIAIKEQRQREKEKRMRKANNRLIFVVVIFAHSWLPLNLFNIVQDYYESLAHWEYLTNTFLIVHQIACSSVCWNPILYAWMSETYRQDLRHALPAFVVARLFRCLIEAPGAGHSSMSGHSHSYAHSYSYSHSHSHSHQHTTLSNLNADSVGPASAAVLVAATTTTTTAATNRRQSLNHICSGSNGNSTNGHSYLANNSSNNNNTNGAHLGVGGHPVGAQLKPDT